MSLPLFPSCVVAGFECSTPIKRYGRRIDELALTQHDRHVRQDYSLLRELGILVARDGVRWNLIDQRGRLDFSSVLPFLDAAEAEEITVIWDLFHYGYPDDLDPFHPEFVARFADYCYAFARLVARRGGATPYYTPVNEISYFAWAAGDQGDFAPHAHGRGPELKRQLARASIVGMNAILAVDARARFVHCDPLCQVVAPADAPHLADEVEHFNTHCVHEAWDMIGGILHRKQREKAHAVTAEDLMTAPPVTVSPDDAVDHAAYLMYVRGVKRLPRGRRARVGMGVHQARQ